MPLSNDNPDKFWGTIVIVGGCILFWLWLCAIVVLPLLNKV